MKVVLLAGSFAESDGQNPSTEFVDNKIWLDHVIESAKQLNCEIEVVLGKNGSDEILRNSLYLKECNIVFDPNEEEVGKMSNLRAGLFSSYRECIAFPMNQKIPRLEVWQKVLGKVFQLIGSDYDLVVPFCPENGAMKQGFPIGITSKGRQNILDQKNLASLEDADLKVYRLPVLDKSIFQATDITRQNLPEAL